MQLRSGSAPLPKPSRTRSDIRGRSDHRVLVWRLSHLYQTQLGRRSGRLEGIIRGPNPPHCTYTLMMCDLGTALELLVRLGQGRFHFASFHFRPRMPSSYARNGQRGTTTTTTAMTITEDMCDDILALSEEVHSEFQFSSASVFGTKAPPTSIPTLGGTAANMMEPMAANTCALSWQHLSYWVNEDRVVWGSRQTLAAKKKEGKRILHEITGRCGPGELMAIMGPSGSGKTTLLDILADRMRVGTIGGFVRLNGEERRSEVFRHISSYVSREESLLGSLTVRETLLIAADLSLPIYMPRSVRDLRVETVLDNMGLRNCQHTLVGSLFHKGLSSGQKRRLSIAIELLSNPSILLLDEPTSGLDSAGAYGVVQCLVDLCLEWNKTVVLTIHQPSSACYSLFSHTLVLAEGKSVYAGRADRAVDHFASLGYVCSIYSNPAEHMLSLVNRDFDGHADVDELAQGYARSPIAQAVALQITMDWRDASNFPEIRADAGMTSGFAQFLVLLRRNALIAVRNPGMYWIRLAMYIMLSLLIGTVYLRSNNDITDLHRAAMIFYLQAFLIFMSVAVVPFFIEQRFTFVRERMNHSLRVWSFVAANFVASLPGIFVISIVSSTIVIALTGLQRFPMFLFNIFLTLVSAESFMCVISALVPNYVAGIALGAGFYGMFMVVEGFMVPINALPVYWLWLHYAAFHSYSYAALMHDHFSSIDTPSGHAILSNYGLVDVDIMRNMLILVAYTIALQVIFGILMRYRHCGH